MAELGIATNVHYKPLPMFTAYKNLGFDIRNFPNAYAQYANEITLPLHTSLSDDHVEYICKGYKVAIDSVLNKRDTITR
jgi:dTDP-4-amino-4,6-dideoxygalactose transaminase